MFGTRLLRVLEMPKLMNRRLVAVWQLSLLRWTLHLLKREKKRRFSEAVLVSQRLRATELGHSSADNSSTYLSSHILLPLLHMSQVVLREYMASRNLTFLNNVHGVPIPRRQRAAHPEHALLQSPKVFFHFF